jgi:hypothetical protein
MARLIISYCRADQHLIRPFTKLLGGALSEADEAVYWDERFEPGSSWIAQFEKGLSQADKLFVFWCDHSAASAAVNKELVSALAKKIVVIPVILDDTPLPPTIEWIHGIDLRPTRVHRLNPIRTMVPRATRSARALLHAAVGEGRRIDSLTSYTTLTVVALAWGLLCWLWGGPVIAKAWATIRDTLVYLVVYGPPAILAAHFALSFARRRMRLHALTRDHERPGSLANFVVREFSRRLHGTQRPEAD